MEQRRLKYKAIAEMANTEGWIEIERLIKDDIIFSSKLLCRAKKTAIKDKEGNIIDFVEEWMKDEHSLGQARGILKTAQKYIDLVEVSKKKQNNYE